VIEFANGVLETAKRPLPRPPRPEKKPQPAAQSVQSVASSPDAEPPISSEAAGPSESIPHPQIIDSVEDSDEAPVAVAAPAAESHEAEAPPASEPSEQPH
jgi:hypothetical protein